jgi:hypothetical protein
VRPGGVGHRVVDIGVRRAPIAAHCAAGQVTGPDEFVKCGARPVARLGFWLGCDDGAKFCAAGDEFGQKWHGHDSASPSRLTPAAS